MINNEIPANSFGKPNVKPHVQKLVESAISNAMSIEAEYAVIDLSHADLVSSDIPWIGWRLSKLSRSIDLNLAHNSLRDDGVKALLACENLPPIVALNLLWNSINETGVEAIAASPRLQKLETLDLAQNHVRELGARALSAATGLRNLKSLNLYCNHLNDDGIEYLMSGDGLPRLEELDLSHNNIHDRGAKAIAKHQARHTLKKLNLQLNFIETEGVVALAKSDRLYQLETLDLGRNRIGDLAVEAIASSPFLNKLRSLDLSHSSVGDAGVTSLTQSSNLHNLENLVLEGNNLIESAEDVVRLLQAAIANGKGRTSLKVNVRECNLRWVEWPARKSFKGANAIDARVSSTTTKDIDAEVLLKQLLASRPDIADQFVAARITLAGLGMSGKTRLSRWLVGHPKRHEDVDPSDRTIGIEPLETVIDGSHFGHPELGEVNLTVLDCGGQQEQLQSHHNFIYKAAERSLFILCLHAGKDFRSRSGNRSDYYLRMLQSYHASNLCHLPVIVIVTHADIVGQPRLLPSDLEIALGLKSEPSFDPATRPKPPIPVYPLLRLAVIDSFNGHDGTNLPKVRNTIIKYLANMREIRALMPAGVLRLRDALGKKFTTSEFFCSITPQQFIDVCKESGFLDESLYGAYLRHLASLGAVIAPGVEKTADAEARRLDSIVIEIFNPAYVNRYVYGLLMNEQLRAAQGFMSDAEFRHQTSALSEVQRQGLRKLLKDKLVAFEWNHENETGLLVPDLLPERVVLTTWNEGECGVRLSFRGVVLGESRFFEFLAAFRLNLEKLPLTEQEARLPIQPLGLFRNECRVTKDGGDALIQIDVVESHIDIVVRGSVEVSMALRDAIVAQLVRVDEASLGEARVGDKVFLMRWSGQTLITSAVDRTQAFQQLKLAQTKQVAEEGATQKRVCRIAVIMEKKEISLDGEIVSRGAGKLCYLFLKLIEADGHSVESDVLCPEILSPKATTEPSRRASALLQNTPQCLKALVGGLPGAGGRWLKEEAFSDCK